MKAQSAPAAYRGITADKTIQHMLNGTMSGKFRIWKVASLRLLLVALAVGLFYLFYDGAKTSVDSLTAAGLLLNVIVFLVQCSWSFHLSRVFYFGGDYVGWWHSAPESYTWKQRVKANSHFWPFCGIYFLQGLVSSVVFLAFSLVIPGEPQQMGALFIVVISLAFFVFFALDLFIIGLFAPLLGRRAVGWSEADASKLLHYRSGDIGGMFLSAMATSFFLMVIPIGVILGACVGLTVLVLKLGGGAGVVFVSGFLGAALVINWIVSVRTCFSASIFSQRAMLNVQDPLIQNDPKPDVEPIVGQALPQAAE